VAPQVSVVVPTHDRRHLLMRTLRTVLWQQDVEMEVIVVDDGSVDDTQDAVAQLADPRIRYVRNRTAGGVAQARNRGAQEAEGEWIAFVDDDDLWAPAKLSEQLKAAHGDGRPWAYAGTVKIDGADRIVGGRPPPPPEWAARRLPTWNSVPGGCSGVIAARALFAEVGGFDPALVNLADWDLWIRFARIALPACATGPLVAYRWHPGNASLDTGLILREARRIADRYGSPPDWGAIHYYLAHLCIRSRRRFKALRHFAAAVARGERSAARDVAWFAGRSLKGANRVEETKAEPQVVAWRKEAESWLSEIRPDSHL
jgi:glycosyltransferase involved in cell wall biosynthesis